MASLNSARQSESKSSDDPPFVSLLTPFPESSSASKYQPYDVFINHRGIDTKDTVAKVIYKELNHTGLKVFLDKDELEPGDFLPAALRNAIATSSVHIAVFSENYATSPWCLDELACMLSPNFPRKATFIPIFYHVEPCTLRWVIKSYGEAFTEYKAKNRYIEHLQSWKKALHDASKYMGSIIDNQRAENEEIMNVVTNVKKLKVSLKVSNYPVGLDKIEQDFNKTLQSAAGPIQIVGIWGMGGVGKTTLAKHIYNKKFSNRYRSSFLSNVRASKLYETQKKLLEDLKWKDTDFDNVEDINEKLRLRLNSLHVLIVLDDVDHTDQLDALLPEKDNLGSGSLIIVTTRDKKVLDKWDISTVYEIKPLHPSYAKELFCWHAFGHPSPLGDFEELVKKFTTACGGLPLSLKVLGRMLRGENREEYWKSILNEVSNTVPEDIKSKLKISYDALDFKAQEMFLDVACFFIGWTSRRAIAIWDGSKWPGLYGWESLMNKCLVEIDEYNEIRMHDHLRDLGREIANEQSPYRLWYKQQTIKIQPQQETLQIRGMAGAFGENCNLWDGQIRLKTNQGPRTLKPGSLELKIFIATEEDFLDDRWGADLFMRRFLLAEEILCFRWECYFEFASTNLSSWLPIKELRILKLCAGELETLWECDEDVTTSLPLQLRELEIINGDALKRINGLQKLTSLETLILEDCDALETLPSLAGATSLKVIDLIWCNQLEKIESLEGLKSLQTLRIDWCDQLKALPCLAGAPSLKEIEIHKCDLLKKIEGLEGLKSLEILKIRGCKALGVLPNLAGATSLKVIKLLLCCQSEKIEGLECLRSLKTLKIKFYAGATSLKKIDLSQCRELEKIDLYNWSKLETIEGLEGLGSLKILKIADCDELKTHPSLANLTSLGKFELTGCKKVEKVEGLEGLKLLRILKIKSCPALETLPSLAELTSLEEIELTACGKVEKVKGLEVLTSLKKVKVHMWWMKFKLEQSERLEEVEVAGKREVIEACIRETEKWPRKVVMCAWDAVTDLMSLRNFFTSFPENMVEHSCGSNSNLQFSRLRSAYNAILICLVVNSIHPTLECSIHRGNGDSFSTSISNGEWLRLGNSPQQAKWVWMGIYPQQANLGWMCIYSQESNWRRQDSHLYGSGEMEGWLLTGTEQSIRENFRRLCQSESQSLIAYFE